MPRPEALEAFLRQEGLTPPAPSAGQPGAPQGEQSAAPESADPALLRALSRVCNRHLAERPGARPDERLQGVALVQPFTIEAGLLTQTLKQRRDRIAARDAAAIARIYGD